MCIWCVICIQNWCTRLDWNWNLFFVCFCSLNRSSYLDKIWCVLYLNYNIDNCSISYTLKTIIKLLLFYVKYYKEMKCLNHIFFHSLLSIQVLKHYYIFFLCVQTGRFFFFIIVDQYMHTQWNLSKTNYLPWTNFPVWNRHVFSFFRLN